MVQLSLPYMTTEKTIALTIQISVGRVMSLLFNALSRFVITFLPRSNYLLISWLQSLSRVILEPKKIKSVTASTLSPSICREVRKLSAEELMLLNCGAGKDSDAGRDWGQEEKGMTEDEMVGWHHRLDGLEFE